MRKTKRFILTAVLSVFVTVCTLAQNNNGPSVSLKGWHLLDWKQDHVYGISLQQAYDFLKARELKPHPTISGVIDSGADTTHEDLKNVLWTNRFEIAGNGKDDERNGYMDDVHGWNFLGNKNGENVGKESIEGERVYLAYKSKWENIDSIGITRLSRDERYDYNMWKRAAKNTKHFAKKSQATTNGSEIDDAKPKNLRDEVVRDNYNDINDRYYGNSDVTATDPMHGTHVAGIIGAQRNNNIGVNGIADDVHIMVVRAVPDGDEYDKDIAIAIRYAVDNGARVINMSFGKDYSPGKKWVDDAVKYAQKKDVLLVHAAGNESKNIDKEFNYPSPVSKDSSFTATNWITVGASGMSGRMIAAPFSNYGKQNVDVFAPGVRIYSTLPKSKYGFLDGTSMAAPVVVGLAALIREYFPDLSARQVKYAIEQSVIKPEELVTIPGTKEKVPLSNLCRTGGIVNALGAVELASSLKGELNKRAVKKVLKKAMRYDY